MIKVLKIFKLLRLLRINRFKSLYFVKENKKINDLIQTVLGTFIYVI